MTQIPISGDMSRFGGGPPNTQRSTPAYISPAAVDNRATAVPSSTADQRMLDFARRVGSGTTVSAPPPRPVQRPGQPTAVSAEPLYQARKAWPSASRAEQGLGLNLSSVGQIERAFQAPPAFSPEAVRQTPPATVDRYMSPELARIPSIRLGVDNTADAAMLDFAQRVGAIQPSIRQSITDPADTQLFNFANRVGPGTVQPSIRAGITDPADVAMMNFAERVGPGTVTVPPPVAAPSPYGPNPQMVVPPPPLTVASPYGPNPQMVGPDTSDLGPPSMWGPNPQMPNPADQPAWDAIERVVEAEFGPNQSIYNPEYDTEQFPTYDPSAPPTWGGGPDGEFPGGDFGDGDLGGGNPLEIVNPDTDPVSPFEGVGGNSSDHARKLAYINFMRDALGRQGLRGFADIEREFLLAQRALPGAYNRRGLLDSGQYARGKGLLGDSASRASGRFMSDLRDQYFNLALSEGDANNAYSSEGFAALQALADKLAGEAASIGTVGFGAI